MRDHGAALFHGAQRNGSARTRSRIAELTRRSSRQPDWEEGLRVARLLTPFPAQVFERVAVWGCTLRGVFLRPPRRVHPNPEPSNPRCEMYKNGDGSAYPPNPDVKSGSCLIAGFHALNDIRPSYWNEYRTEESASGWRFGRIPMGEVLRPRPWESDIR